MRWYAFLLHAVLAAAENGLAGWLRYAPLDHAERFQHLVPSKIVVLNSTERGPISVAGRELRRGIESIYSKPCGIDYHRLDPGRHGWLPNDAVRHPSSIVVGTTKQYIETYGDLPGNFSLTEDGFYLDTNSPIIRILGQNERGALYGAFEYLSMIAQGNFTTVAYATNPAAPIRWTNEWDNMDGSIERGYGGPSLFFANGAIVDDLERAADYARLLASIRVNGVVVNNVNANSTLLTAENIAGLGRIADVFRPYGVKLGISLNFASPMEFGGLDTFDPLDSAVIKWWANITDQIYQVVPDMAGYLVKANSEGQPGPITYNRTLAEGTNLFARAVQPHDGVVMFRAFVYDQLNESDWRADRAKAAVDYFKPLDGKFDDNVVVQIKYGPIDFQVREPASPLFANLHNTSTAIELEVTQEYLGQQCHLVYLAPLWKSVLDFDLRVQDESSLVRDIVSGKRFERSLGGSAAVVNVGLGNGTTWLGSHMAMANLYAYGRLAWSADQDSESMLQDWIRLTFGSDRTVLDTITQMSMESWPAYENYSGNLGIQTLTDILYTHYGPNPASQDNNGWGQWTRADAFSIGMDRTVINGTGYSGQYPPSIAQIYEDIEMTPDDLVLWFHHVNYTHKLKSGKSVIQHFYDAHYEGAATAQSFVTLWKGLEGQIDESRYSAVLFHLTYQAGHSIIWRDAICDFYHNLSGISDEHGRVGHHPCRIEAENMDLDGYVLYYVSPFETASNSTAVVTRSNTTVGTAQSTINYPSGIYNVIVNYYDMYGGQSNWEVYINDHLLGEWRGDSEETLGHTPSIYLDGHSAIRNTFKNVKIEEGDTIKVVGQPDGVEPAPLDYVAFLPCGVVD